MRKRNVVTVLVTAAVGASLFFGVTGCQPEPAPGREIAPNPFTSVWGPGEEHIVTFSGNSAGHVAGGQAEFMLKLKNNSSEPWQVEYYVQLLDTDKIVMEIAHARTNVPSGLQPQIDIPVVFDEGLEGPYGLSLYIPTLEAQSVNTIWIGEKSTTGTGDWPSLASHPWLWPEADDGKQDSAIEEAVFQAAAEFIKNSPTYVFDGIEGSLELVNTGAYSERTISADAPAGDITSGYELTYRFNSRHSGYGDRSREMLAQVITSHEVLIRIVDDEVMFAVMDKQWDMVNQKMLAADELNQQISLAPIHEVKINILESFPVQISVYIQGGLRDGCTTFRDAVVTRDKNTVNIEVTTLRPQEAICSQVYSYFEENINLGSDFTPGADYTLNVNDYTTTFTMPD